MIDRGEMVNIAQARLEDATVLADSERCEGAIYMCGYAVEIALKARICETLDWQGYPSTARDFEKYRSFRTHGLDVLLHLSGVEKMIRTEFLTEWSAVLGWDPQARYRPVGSSTKEDAEYMIESARTLLEALWKKQ